MSDHPQAAVPRRWRRLPHPRWRGRRFAYRCGFQHESGLCDSRAYRPRGVTRAPSGAEAVAAARGRRAQSARRRPSPFGFGVFRSASRISCSLGVGSLAAAASAARCIRDLAITSSVLSFIKCRIKAFEIHAGVVRGELPVDLGLDAVSGRLPGRDLVAQGLEGVNATVEALTDQDIEFDLGDVEPTAVLGGVDELKAVPQRLGPCRGKGLVEGAGAVRA